MTTSWTERTSPTTTWDMRDNLGRVWAEMDDTWANEPQTWAEVTSTTWTTRTEP